MKKSHSINIKLDYTDDDLFEGEVLKGMKPSLGLYPAILEFLETGWKIKKEYTNNNGLTILEKV